MSDTDDTDLLLLIPPDFFIINSSDSEDSHSVSRRHDEYRVNELIHQVNELEERVNHIENKDTNSESNLSETGRFNQSLDYSLLLDTTNLHNIGRSDLALRFYSLSSTGFRFGGNSSDCIGVKFTKPSVHCQSLQGSSNSYSLPSEASNTEPHQLHIYQRDSGTFPLNCDILQSASGIMETKRVSEPQYSKYDSDSGTNIGQSQPYWHSTSFLSEIDEYLESKKKQTNDVKLKPSHLGNEYDDRKHTEQYTDNEQDMKLSAPLFKNIPLSRQNSSTFHDSDQHFGLFEVEQLLNEMENTHIEIERKLRSREELARTSNFPSSQEKTLQNSEVSETVHVNNDQHVSDIHLYNGEKRNKETSYIGNVSKVLSETSHSIQSMKMQENNDISYHPEYRDKNKDIIASTSVSTGIQNLDHQNRLISKSISHIPEETGSKNENRNVGVNFSSVLVENMQSKKSNTLFSKSADYYDRNYELSSHVGRVPSNKGNETERFDVDSLDTLPIHRYPPITDESASLRTERLKYYFQPISRLPSANNVDAYELPSNGEDNLDKCHHLKDTESRQQNTVISKTNMNEMEILNHQRTRNDQIVEGIHVHNRSVMPITSDVRTNDIQRGLDLISAKDMQLSSSHSTVNKGASVCQDSVLRTGDRNTRVLDYESHNKKKVEFSDITRSQIHTRKPDVPFQQEDTSNKSSNSRGTYTDDGYYSSTVIDSSATNLLSLSDLWGSEGKLPKGTEKMTMEQKLEEERYRRKHCEIHIQKLQSLLLEEQQKLSVAMRVDHAKDQAIRQLQGAWKRLVTHWQELEDQRNILSIHLSEEKEKHQQNMMEMAQKVKRYELELSKILDLAQGYKEKGESLEQKIQEIKKQYTEEHQDFEAKIEDSQKKLVEAGQDMGNIRREVELLKKRINEAENDVQKKKDSLFDKDKELRKAESIIEKFEADMAAVQEENASLNLRLKEEKNRNNVVDQQKRSFQTALEESKRNEKSLRDEIKEKTGILEKIKVELRDYYQQQVEVVVREKLAEFQSQLDAAEASLHEEIEKKEKAAHDAATKQIKHVTEKNQLEVKLLEEKHQEEIQLYKLQLTQAAQQILQLQTQLQSYSNRKTEIVEKLHNVMETQWQEALRIISGNSPIVYPSREINYINMQEEKEGSVPKVPTQQASSTLITNSKELQSQSVHNVLQHTNSSIMGHSSQDMKSAFTVTPIQLPNVTSLEDSTTRNEKTSRCVIQPIHFSQDSGSSTTDEMPFSREGQVTYRVNHETHCNKIPSVQENSSEIVKKYIEMLLNRAPGDVAEGPELHCENNEQNMDTPVSERRTFPRWEKIMENNTNMNTSSQGEVSKYNTIPYKDTRTSKPPWK